jgi:hypothetical protein
LAPIPVTKVSLLPRQIHAATGSAGDSCASLPPYAVIHPPETGAMAATFSGCTAAKLFVIIAPLENPVIVVRHGSVP